MPKEADEYTEILGDLYSKTGQQHAQKLDIIKASHLYDKSLEISSDGLEERFNKIIKFLEQKAILTPHFLTIKTPKKSSKLKLLLKKRKNKILLENKIF